MFMLENKTMAHPCYNCGAGKNARIHLPVAPKCNISCNYCVRKYDCPNESRPGVTAEVLTPIRAAERFAYYRGKMDHLQVVGIAGPGDALANPSETLETFRLVREIDPDITLCLSTNGLMLPHYAQELSEIGVSHVTVTLNTVDPKIGAKIYKYVDYLGSVYTGIEAAELLLRNQLAGLKALKNQGAVCKVNTVTLRGINDQQIEKIAQTVRRMGVNIHNVMRMIPVAGSKFEGLKPLSEEELAAVRSKGALHMKQMYHCGQCRADAIGTLTPVKSGGRESVWGSLCTV
ncbi:MAG: radical SAM protein [Peptococcaceae bacterium]|jgi:nitrogenase cofactor biosynthesis protein NifB|nr:radical SAM protein [Peptococcaceae bacterium]